MVLRGHTAVSEKASARDVAMRPGGARRAARLSTRARLGGTEGNAILTSATAAILVVLLVAEGITIVRMRGLVTLHMFLGMLLIPPVVLKLASTGYRFVRYYAGAPTYREKGPPRLPLRVLAPVLVASTAGVFVTGAWLLLLGHRSGPLLEAHKIAFIVWGAVFAVHFLAYLPHMIRSLRVDWTASRRHAVPGTGLRGMLVAASLGAGLALALSLLSAIAGWHAGGLG